MIFVADGGCFEVELEPREARVLAFLAADSYKVFSHEQIYEGVWGYVPVISHTLEVTVNTLRRKLAAAGITLVVTHYGRGYSLR